MEQAINETKMLSFWKNKLLALLEVIIIPISSTTSDENLVNMMMFLFKWCHKMVLEYGGFIAQDTWQSFHVVASCLFSTSLSMSTNA